MDLKNLLLSMVLLPFVVANVIERRISKNKIRFIRKQTLLKSFDKSNKKTCGTCGTKLDKLNISGAVQTSSGIYFACENPLCLTELYSRK